MLVLIVFVFRPKLDDTLIDGYTVWTVHCYGALLLFLYRHSKLVALRQKLLQQSSEAMDTDGNNIRNLANLCSLCVDDRCAIVLFPCGNNGFCELCASQLVVCPICRALIAERRHVDFSLPVAPPRESSNIVHGGRHVERHIIAWQMWLATMMCRSAIIHSPIQSR